jgi:hypothetical protein
MDKLNKRGQTGGLITGLVFGIAALVIGVIIAFVVVSTLSNAELMTAGRTIGTAVLNEAGFINSSTYTLTLVGTTTTNFAITTARNATSGTVIDAANWTISGGVITNATPVAWKTVHFNYTYDTYSDEEVATGYLTTNFTEGVNNVSAKLPTALLVAAIVLILAILGVLVGVWQKMRTGGGSI